MATRGEIGWQSEKTLAECMRYMLDNEIATDVCFEVGPPDGATLDIRAHKLILMSRSPVFEAMFSSGMTESKNEKEVHVKIRIEDIDPDVFKELLRYVYYDNVEISPETAPPLMYAAKKYLLPKLSKACSVLLQTSVKIENVCYLLDQSILFSEENLRDDCLTFISSNSSEILKAEEFLESFHQALAAILKIERMRSKESVVYQSCENWAKHQLRLHKSIENPSDEEIRETLGSLLYDIRFPTMDPEEFADLVGKRAVLTDKEKSSVYFHFIKRENIENLGFNVNKRFREEKKFVDRTITVDMGQWNSAAITDAVDFTTNREVMFSGLGLFTGFNGVAYNVDIEILEYVNSLFKKRFTIPFTGNSTPFKIAFDSPISIRPGVIYTIVAFTRGHIGCYSNSCKAVCKIDDITFMFSNSNRSASTDVTRGQIPQLFFF